MLNRDGRPRPDIFGKDSLHMNAKGYSIWQKKLRKSYNKPPKKFLNFLGAFYGK